MLTGQTVFSAENYEGWLFEHLQTPPRPPSSLRPELANWKGLDALVLRLLAKDREYRPRDVAELLGLLDAVQLTTLERQPTVHEIRRPTVIEPEPVQPSTTPILQAEINPEMERQSGQVTRLSPELKPDAEVVKPRRGPKWLPEVIILFLAGIQNPGCQFVFRVTHANNLRHRISAGRRQRRIRSAVFAGRHMSSSRDIERSGTLQ
jgi:hypothetical protein